jgi:metal-dependent amidase/aminoacylase/carboxypeptidase family protein
MLPIDGYPPTVNNYPECNKVVQTAASRFVGAERSSRPQKTMGAEDFSYFLQQRPGCFFFVGAALPGPDRPHHKSVFDFDEVRYTYMSITTYIYQFHHFYLIFLSIDDFLFHYS